MEKKYVLITTDKDKRGVFAGILVEDKSPDYVVLNECRMVIYWPKTQRGVLGLASHGPTEGCRITFPAPTAKIFGVTAIFDIAQEAQKEFEKNKWD